MSMNYSKLWKEILGFVRKLQIRIAKAMQQNKFNKVRKLGRILTNSYYAKILAVWRVIINKGGKTAGVDGVIWNKVDDLFDATHSLKRRGYKPKPLRRIYIPKKDGKKRPLGIPTMKDRAMQALHIMALEPVAEHIADPNSYGFRRNRSCRDAMQHVFRCLAQKSAQHGYTKPILKVVLIILVMIGYLEISLWIRKYSKNG